MFLWATDQNNQKYTYMQSVSSKEHIEGSVSTNLPTQNGIPQPPPTTSTTTTKVRTNSNPEPQPPEPPNENVFWMLIS